ncbi:hypothetical protein [Vaginisenegalia massiliensis]|uniref:hypothetical protein n=1 Tax=Vaginisenegalia massiliensis TaxID=2058294 RepID=UPI000F528419|nr:hypothetical protein [Vaginisenegalia massiliensis]
MKSNKFKLISIISIFVIFNFFQYRWSLENRTNELKIKEEERKVEKVMNIRQENAKEHLKKYRDSIQKLKIEHPNFYYDDILEELDSYEYRLRGEDNVHFYDSSLEDLMREANYRHKDPHLIKLAEEQGNLNE